MVSLGYEDLEHLNDIMEHEYYKWVEGALDNYLDNTFLLDQSPIIVTSWFGQNMILKGDDDEHNTHLLREWGHDWDYNDVHYIAVAIAMHIEYVDFYDE